MDDSPESAKIYFGPSEDSHEAYEISQGSIPSLKILGSGVPAKFLTHLPQWCTRRTYHVKISTKIWRVVS